MFISMFKNVLLRIIIQVNSGDVLLCIENVII